MWVRPAWSHKSLTAFPSWVREMRRKEEEEFKAWEGLNPPWLALNERGGSPEPVGAGNVPQLTASKNTGLRSSTYKEPKSDNTLKEQETEPLQSLQKQAQPY